MRYGAQVQGWFHDPEGERLVELARDAPGTIVELGTQWGKSISYILHDTDKDVVCVDWWQDDSEFQMFTDLLQENHWESRVEMVRQSTQDAAKSWTRPIGLLHIDAGHDYENVLADYTLWSPHIVPGGAIAFHDREMAGPARVLRDLVLPDPRWLDRRVVMGQWSARLEEQA